MAHQEKTSQHGAGGHGHEHAAGGHGIGRYVLIWGLLLVFTIITVVTGRNVHLPGYGNIIVAMVIATTKATLVVLFFMHLWEEGGVNRLIFVSSIVFALVMLLGIFGDLLTRAPGALPNGGPMPIKANLSVTGSGH